MEIGGTVGDIESLPFLEAIRQLRHELGRENTLFVHVTLVPWIAAAQELKTKPTQHSVKELRAIGIQPDILLCRSENPIPQDMKEKIALFCDVDVAAVITASDVASVYECPLVFADQGVDEIVLRLLEYSSPGPRDLTAGAIWCAACKEPARQRFHRPGRQVCRVRGFLQEPEGSAAAWRLGARRASVEISLGSNRSAEVAGVACRSCANSTASWFPADSDGAASKACCTPSASRANARFLISASAWACRPWSSNTRATSAASPQANSTEFDPATPDRVIYKLRELKGIDELGGTMRLGAYPCLLAENSFARAAYGTREISERHRHRYEFNREYETVLKQHGLRLTGETPDGVYVEICELPGHPWYLGCQFHPEFKSKPLEPHPLFRAFIGASLRTSPKESASCR